MKLLLFICLLWSMAVEAHVGRSYEIQKTRTRHAKGLKRHPESRKFLVETQKLSFTRLANPIPGNVDLSSQVSLPENQGQCGCCWDFSLTKALRSEFMVKGIDPGALEFNYLLNNCGPGPQQYGCNGGDFNAAQSFLSGAGPGLNSQNPFTGAAMMRCAGLPVAATAVSYVMLGNGSVGPTFKDLAYAVGVEKHMLSIDVAASSGDWEYYSGGIYNGCAGGPNSIDHMIDMVGYDCESSKDDSGNCVFDAMGRPVNGDGYILVENNWGESWGIAAGNGHKGYMKTRLYGADGSKCNAIATNALMFNINAPGPKPPTPPTPPPAPPKPCSWWKRLFGLC